MATKKQVQARCAELGVRYSEDDHTMYADTPDGKVFAGSGCGSIVAPYRNNGGQSWKPQAYDEMMQELSHGVEAIEGDELAAQVHERGNCTPATCSICTGGAA